MNGTRTSWWDRIRPAAGLARPVATLFWAYLLWNVGFTLYATVWTVFVQRLGAAPAEIGLVVGAAAVGRTLLSYSAGVLADRRSPLAVVGVSMALPVAGLLILLVSTTWWQALVAAVVIELSGLGVPALSAWLAAASPAGQRTRAFTWVYTVAPQAALLLGPALSGMVADRLGFPAVFTAAGTFFLAAVLIVVRLGRARPDGTPVGSVTSTVRAGAEPAPEGDGPAPDASIPVTVLLRPPAIRTIVLLHLLVPLLPFTGFVLLANFLVGERDVSLSLIGTLGSIGAAVGLAVSLAIARVPLLSNPFTGIAACLGAAIAALALLQLDGPVVVLAIAYALRALLNPVWSFLSAALAEVTPERRRGRVYGLAETSAGVGDVAAPLAAGGLYQVSPGLPLVVACLTTIPLAFWAVVLGRRVRRADQAG